MVNGMGKNTNIKTRCFPESNYKAVFLNGKTIRMALDSFKPITELKYPEFYDVKITGKCEGNCPWCYQDSKSEDEHYDNVLPKIDCFFGRMTENQKPFQVALGGGEPTLHPQFIDILKEFDSLGIMPNYTTNAMHMTDDIINATMQYCGGIAISCHEHLYSHWKPFLHWIGGGEIKVNLHIIISDKESIDRFRDIFYKHKDIVDHFVLLPHVAQGRASSKNLQCEYLFNEIDKLNTKKVAFGALFYPYLLKNQKRFDVSLYEPEIMSKYLDLKDMRLYKSSFEVD